MRDRLIELIQGSVGGCERHCAAHVANYLLANGVIAPPIIMGQELYGLDGCIKKVVSMSFYEHGLKMFSTIVESQAGVNSFEAHFFNELGKTVFLTREDAEKALKGENE